MNARQLTRTGLVLLGVYFVAGGLSLVAGVVATEALHPGNGEGTGFDWASLWSVAMFVIPVMCVPGVVLIAASGWLSRRVASADDEALSATSPPELLGVGLTFLGAVLVALALVHMLASGPLLWEDGPGWPLVGPLLIGPAVNGALGILLVVFARPAARLAGGMNGGGEAAESSRQLVRVGLILVGAVIVILGLTDLVSWVTFRLEPDLYPQLLKRAASSHAAHRLRLVEGLTRCVLGALVMHSSRDIARFVYR